jgi:hypothetical protein
MASANERAQHRRLARALAKRAIRKANRSGNDLLERIGWKQSAIEQIPLSPDGKPVPWFTYAATSFLSCRVKRNMRVFEYGSGNSTIWWSSAVDCVTACEHDSLWFNKTKASIPANVNLIYRELDENGAYCRAIEDCEGLFDIIVIDGRDRVNCAKISVHKISSDGVFVWDNSNRRKYQPGYDLLHGAGFKRIDFHGIGPILAAPWSTSIFYRSRNCLDI